MKLIVWMAIVSFAPAAGAQSPDRPRVPVLAELFTSEGCSSCPPADALLRKLDETQPVPEAEIVVMSEHVDYWNQIGWTDPYSSPRFSARQQSYAAQFHLDSVFTPQLVVDGREQFVGSDESAIRRGIERAARVPKAALEIDPVSRENGALVVRVQGSGIPGRVPARLFLALADNRDISHVGRGENSGRTLIHVAVVRTLVDAGAAQPRAPFARTIRVPLQPGWNLDAMRAIAFARDRNGVVSAAAMRPLRP